MKGSQIYRILKLVTDGKNSIGKSNLTQTYQTLRQPLGLLSLPPSKKVTMRINNLALMYGDSFGTIQIILVKDLCLAKKSARSLFTKEQKQERVREGEEILDESAMA
jgi:hypothetical protein